MSPQAHSQRTARFSISSDSYAQDCHNDASASSCDASPTSPCSTLPQDAFNRRNEPPFRSLQDPFSSPAAPSAGQQPFGSYFEQVSSYRSAGYMFPNCPVGECRSTKSVGDLWQSRDEAQPLPMFPTWRPTLDTSFRNDIRQDSISPQSCSSTTSEEYLPGSIDSQRFGGNHGGSNVYNFSSAPRIVPLPVTSEAMLSMYDNGQGGNMERKEHKPQRSFSQPNVDIRA